MMYREDPVAKMRIEAGRLVPAFSAAPCLVWRVANHSWRSPPKSLAGLADVCGRPFDTFGNEGGERRYIVCTLALSGVAVLDTETVQGGRRPRASRS
jgi:hypothetical protein